MRTYHEDLNYDKENMRISFLGDMIVDVSKVPQRAKATIYSVLSSDFEGVKTEFQVNGTQQPFDIKLATLSPTGLIKAIVENRLEVEGMIVSTAIEKAYTYLEESYSLQ